MQMGYVVMAGIMFLVMGAALIGAIIWAAATDPSDADEEAVSHQGMPAH